MRQILTKGEAFDDVADFRVNFWGERLRLINPFPAIKPPNDVHPPVAKCVNQLVGEEGRLSTTDGTSSTSSENLSSMWQLNPDDPEDCLKGLQ